jgi:hypothetical protein
MFRETRLANSIPLQKEDAILAEAAGEATKWMSLQEHQRMNFRVVPAQRATITYTGLGHGRTFDDVIHPDHHNITKTETIIQQLDLSAVGADAIVEVQYKSNGQRDEAAQTIERHVLTGTAGEFLDLSSCTGRRGFVRVIVRSLNAPVAVFAEIVRAPDVS